MISVYIVLRNPYIILGNVVVVYDAVALYFEWTAMYDMKLIICIGWVRSHVWGHFCLCYEGQKLLDDKVSIRRLGIKDGDQVVIS